MERDAAAASAEYLAQFRIDIESFVAREAVEAAVVSGRRELPPLDSTTYFAFTDPAGGSGGDSMSLAIAHRDNEGRAILDAVRERQPPFSPADCVSDFAALLKTYGVSQVVGDRYGGEFVREPFRAHGLEYELAAAPKSDFYRDWLPLLNSHRVELLDHTRLIGQLCNLERRVGRSGKDSIDHAPGAHDDLSNAAAAALVLAGGEPDALSVWRRLGEAA